MTTAPMVVLKDIAKRWNGQLGVEAISLDIPEGSFTALLGPSGCGKSTTLRLLAGLELPDEGTILIDGKDVTTSAASDRNLSMVFQSYALFPHLSVAENVVFGLKVRRVPKQERQEKLHRALEITGLLGYENRKPGELSGGQRQRVALARAIVAGQRLCLMDEPLSNLDAKLRNSVRKDIKKLQRDLGITVIYVTHDQTEAMTLADKIVVLQSGRIEQTGAPLDIYNNPQNVFVAGFIGSPRMNLIEATANQGAEGWTLTAPNMSVPIPNVDCLTDGAHCTFGIRPEHVSIATEGSGHTKAQVAFAEQLGGETYLYCDVEGSPQITVHQPGQLPIVKGQTLALNFALENMHLFDAYGQVIVNQVTR